MNIKTREQEVLELILKYWDNADTHDLQSTIKTIKGYYPAMEYSQSLDWTFRMTRESSVNLSKKYLNQELPENCNEFMLVVDSSTLSMIIFSYEEYLNNCTRMIQRVLLT